MKLIQYATAYMALSVLSKKELPYKIAYAIVELRRRLAPKAEFYAVEERKLVERYGKRDSEGKLLINGTSFDCKGETTEEISQNAREYERLRRELGAVEGDEVCERVTLGLPSGVTLTPEAIEALEPFVLFEVEK